MLTDRLPRLAGAHTVTALLVTLTGVLVALAAVAVVDRSWWDVLTAAVLGVGSAAAWDAHLSARAGRPSRLARWHLRRHLARQRGGRRLQTLAELRAEYRQTILDDAARDPILNGMLDEYAGRIAEQVREPKGQVGIGELDRLTAYANGYVDGLSEAGRRGEWPLYRDYSTEIARIRSRTEPAAALHRSPARRTGTTRGSPRRTQCAAP